MHRPQPSFASPTSKTSLTNPTSSMPPQTSHSFVHHPSYPNPSILTTLTVVDLRNWNRHHRLRMRDSAPPLPQLLFPLPPNGRFQLPRRPYKCLAQTPEPFTLWLHHAELQNRLDYRRLRLESKCTQGSASYNCYSQ